MDESDIPYTERELIQRSINGACARHAADCSDGLAAPKARWDVVKDLFCYGSTTSAAICLEYGFDPDEIIGDDADGETEDEE